MGFSSTGVTAKLPSPITHRKLLIVEGQDDFKFFLELLRHLGLEGTVEIRPVGGTGEFGKYLRTLPVTPGFEQVVSLGIVRDADENAQSAFLSIHNSLRQTSLSVPKAPLIKTSEQPSVSIFILPDCVNPGMLETLCLQSVDNEAAFDCIDDYFLCIENVDGLPSNMEKAKLYAYLATRARPEMTFRQATVANYWPWDHPVFDTLKEFLRAL